MDKKTFMKLIDIFVLNDKADKRGKWAEPKEITWTNKMKAWKGGFCSYGFLSTTIEIRPKYKKDLGIRLHELTHARQFGRRLWLHTLLSMWSGKYRLLIELQAYRNQIREYRYTKKSQYDWIVNALDAQYNTGVSKFYIEAYADYAFRDVLC